MILAALLLIAGDAPAPDAADQKPPVVQIAPTAPPPPVVRPPPEVPPTVPPLPDKKKPKVEEPHGLDTLPMGILQVVAGGGACCVGCCVSIPPAFLLGFFVPVVGTLLANTSTDLIVGVAVGGTEGALGDMLGNDRGALAWPVAVSVGSLLLGTAAGAGLAAVEKANGVVEPTDPTDSVGLQRFAQQDTPYALASLTISCATLTGAIVLPAVIYTLTSTPKKPGDTGQGFPGIFSPADPLPVDTKTITVAMAY